MSGTTHSSRLILLVCFSLNLCETNEEMVRIYKRKPNRAANYTAPDIKKALKNINWSIMTAYSASKKYNIPQSTLSSRRRGIRGKRSSTTGRSRSIPIEEARKLVACITTMEK